MAVPAFVISLLAFGFAVLSFWWMHWRTGSLRVVEPRTYQGYASATAKMILAIPFVFFNDGPTPILVNNLRLRFLHEPGAEALTWQATLEQLNYDEEKRRRSYATPFAVEGRQALLKICEFQREPAGWEFEAKEYRIAMDASIGVPAKWKQLVLFPLAVTKESAQTLNKQFLVRSNPVGK